MANSDNATVIRVAMSYEFAKENEYDFLSLTSLTVTEFDLLCKNFEKTLEKRGEVRNEDSGPLKNAGGRPAVLKSAQDKLFFILVYLKNYPLQTLMGCMFGLSQSRANYWIHFLSDVLKETLKDMGVLPASTPQELSEILACDDKQDLSIDGTERRINRPHDNEEQKRFYSGKKKTHTVKNLIIGGNNDREIKYLGDTVEGKKHDKKVLDESDISLPEGSTLYQDTGFQGYQPEGVNIMQPKKKPKGGELTEEEKKDNKLISKVRIVIEHVIAGIKRLHVVKAVFRNTKEGYDDLVMRLACGLHNLRERFSYP
jgi:DDE superfamily endonuclease/Helix-turn-helix of DDE superfamily endonuclease